MADGKLYIIVTNQLPGGSEVPGETDKEKEKKEGQLSNWVVHQYLNLVKQQALNCVNFSINNIGNFTGDYQLQRDAQNVVAVLNEIAGLATSVFAGAKIGGGVGVAVALSVYGITKTVSTVQRYQLIDLQQRQSDYSIQQLKNRSGLNTRYDGSRGTEN